jgi:hypothetical protein
VAVPASIPLTRPELTDALDGLLLLQVPPAVASLRLVVPPSHTVAVPLIAVAGSTVTIAVAIQPPKVVYDISEVPPVIPVTTPLTEPTVATAGVWLTQVPPRARSLRVIVDPWHTGAEPVMADNEFTVTTTVV